jgi:cytochrome c oxidase cbb3-type subunit 3
MDEEVHLWMMITAYILSATAIILLFALWLVLDYIFKDKYGFTIIPTLTVPSFLKPVLRLFTFSNLVGLRPASAAKAIDEEVGHEYDGIRELDNGAPPLFNYILYGTIFFAIIYAAYYHLGGGHDQTQEYYASVREAEIQLAEYRRQNANLVDENSVTQTTDGAILATGQAIFTENCAACHGPQGQGLTGPNLTDTYWLHGATIRNVFHTISEGVPANGMIAWKAQLSPSQIAAVANYVLSLQGTNPPNPRAPEGTPVGAAPDSAATAPTDSTPRVAAASR